MNDKDDFQILRDERAKLVNENADRQTENIELREAVELNKRIGRLEYAIELAIESIDNNTVYHNGLLKKILTSALK